MSISGTTNTYETLGNDQFIKSGDTVSTPNSVMVTDANGMDISKCFGINSEIIDDIDSSLGDCESILEIKITKGLTDDVECPVSYTQQPSDGLILAEYADGSTTLNVHPDCCEALSFTKELGVDGYFVCRWKIILDPLDCANYIPKTGFDSNNHKWFTFDNIQTTVVPSVECCYPPGLTEEIIDGEIHCIEIELAVCERYTVIGTPAAFGDIEFLDTETQLPVTVVPTLDCCTSKGFSYIEQPNGGFTCNINPNPPTIDIMLDELCCEPESTGGDCNSWEFITNERTLNGESIVTISYVDCAGEIQNYSRNFFQPGFRIVIDCVKTIKDYSPNVSSVSLIGPSGGPCDGVITFL